MRALYLSDLYCVLRVGVCARTGVRESHGDSGSAAARAPRRHDRHGATLHSAVDAPPEPRARRRSIRTLSHSQSQSHSFSHSCRYRCIRHATPPRNNVLSSAPLPPEPCCAAPALLSSILPISPHACPSPTPRRRAAALLCSAPLTPSPCFSNAAPSNHRPCPQRTSSPHPLV